jgi:hypothetical protein
LFEILGGDVRQKRYKAEKSMKYATLTLIIAAALTGARSDSPIGVHRRYRIDEKKLTVFLSFRRLLPNNGGYVLALNNNLPFDLRVPVACEENATEKGTKEFRPQFSVGGIPGTTKITANVNGDVACYGGVKAGDSTEFEVSAKYLTQGSWNSGICMTFSYEWELDREVGFGTIDNGEPVHYVCFYGKNIPKA